MQQSLALDLLAVPATLVMSKSRLSLAGGINLHCRGCSEDDISTTCMCVSTVIRFVLYPLLCRGGTGQIEKEKRSIQRKNEGCRIHCVISIF